MIGSQDSLNTANLKTVEFAIKKAVEEFLPILDQPKDPQYNKVQSETTEESELLQSSSLIQLRQRLKMLQRVAKLSLLHHFKRNFKQSLENNSGKIKIFFVKQFGKAAILRIAKNTRAKFLRKGKVESSELLEQLVNDTQVLTDMLNKYASQGMASETLPDLFRRTYIKRKTKVFLALMRWWL